MKWQGSSIRTQIIQIRVAYLKKLFDDTKYTCLIVIYLVIKQTHENLDS